jgi:hypothetical protein
MSTRRPFLFTLAALISIFAATLTVAGDVSTPLTMAAADLKSMPRKQVEMKDEGRTVVYEVLFSLPELDPAFTANDIIIADTIDGKPLFAYQGPLRIVSPKDSRAARSIRMLQRLDVVRLRK